MPKKKEPMPMNPANKGKKSMDPKMQKNMEAMMLGPVPAKPSKKKAPKYKKTGY